MAPSQSPLVPDFGRPPFAGAKEARFEPAPADGVLPDGFFSTSNLPTYVRVGARWLLPARPRMDGVIVRRGDALETVEPRLVHRGEPVAMGLGAAGRGARASWSTAKGSSARAPAPTSSASWPPK